MRNAVLVCTLTLAALPLSWAASSKEKSQSDPAKEHGSMPADRASSPEKEPAKNAYSFELPGADGKPIPVSTYKGKAVMLVNLGRKSSYNEQIEGIAKLQERYKDLVIIGIPCNDFGAAEPGTAEEIQKAYKSEPKTAFTVTALAVLTGEQKLPLYDYLTKSKDAPAGGEVHWNFTKFLIDRNGKVVSRLDPDVLPDSPEMLSTLDDILGEPKDRPASGKREGEPSKAKTPNSKV
jgi:glutathione peroxidase